jgi:cytochrome c553
MPEIPNNLIDRLNSRLSRPSPTAFEQMPEVVSESLQHLAGEDITSMAIYLKSQPETNGEAKSNLSVAAHEADAILKPGVKIYAKQRVECHKAKGREGASPAYPPLAGNRSLIAHSAINPIRIVLNGGFPPSTGGNPRPYGMPPFAVDLNDSEVAAV